MKDNLTLPLVGALVAAVAIILVHLGNPPNMGFCIACFLRDTAGAVGLHSAAPVQYVRPEIIGVILGAFVMALVKGEFNPRGGSAIATRFVLGFTMVIGAMIFLGCPIRMALRIAGGDLNAIVGLFGFAAGVLVGVYFLNKGYTLKRSYDQAKTDGFILPIAAMILLGILVLYPSILLFSTEGPGSMHAPLLASLIAGLTLGAVGYVSRLCFVAGFRDAVLFREFSMFGAFIALVAVAMIGNLALGNFNPGFTGQPIAHNDGIWNFLGMALVGLSAVLLGGCPFRQLVFAGSGNSDSIVTVLGMVAGAATAHNFAITSSAAGVTANGKAALIIAFILVLAIAAYNTFVKKK